MIPIGRFTFCGYIRGCRIIKEDLDVKLRIFTSKCLGFVLYIMFWKQCWLLKRRGWQMFPNEESKW
jgi:hypothetical protein